MRSRTGQWGGIPVQIGIDDGIHVEVKRGLPDGALVLLAGKGVITKGQIVQRMLKGADAELTGGWNARHPCKDDEMDLQNHWGNVYQTKGEADLSWHQEEPALSLSLIREFAPASGRIIDVGGGSSILASRLIDAGHENVTVVDISASALDRAKQRCGHDATRITWRVADITAVDSLGEFDVWHDRAVFHFLTNREDRRKYVELAAKSLPSGGHLIIGTFAFDGPERCSGLPVERYDAKRLGEEFGSTFILRRETQDTHFTPWGKPQNFIFAVFERAV